MFVVRRSPHNPILMPVENHPWEAHATFNWCPIKDGKETHVLYRAMSAPGVIGDTNSSVSTIGHAVTTDGEHFKQRRQLIVPERIWEQYGCEDPRVTKLEDTYYIFYTAISTSPPNPDGIKIALAKSKDLKKIDEKYLITPFNGKAMVLFPKKIGGKFAAILTVNTDKPPSYMAIALFDKEEDMWNQEYWNEWYKNLDDHKITPDPKRKDNERAEVGAPPIETEYGWLLIYSHTQNYFTENDKVFSAEALILDKEDPRKILWRTGGPLLVTQTLYEKSGNVNNIVFPSGVLTENKTLDIYYGAADTTCCKAHVNFKHLLDGIRQDESEKVVRFEDNPILSPNPSHTWEAKAVFNPASIRLEGTTHILYRAMSHDNTSTIGYATSKDGFHIDERLSEPIYMPREPFEKKAREGNTGCEDPRVVLINDRIYMFYTAVNAADPPRVAATSISLKNFLKRKWEWTKPEIITPPGIMDKDTTLIPEKIDRKYLLIHRINDIICGDYLESLDFANEKVTKCIQMVKPRRGMWDSKKIGVAATPIKSEHGWILFYHGVSDHDSYRVGAVMLDLKDPTSVIARTTVPILEPERDYELVGQINKVVFPCGATLVDDTIFLYYGGADSVVAVATLSLDWLIEILTK